MRSAVPGCWPPFLLAATFIGGPAAAYASNTGVRPPITDPADWWFAAAFGALLLAALVIVTVTVRRGRAQIAALPNLDNWDAVNRRPGSRVWKLSPPCGYETWKLYAPGTEHDADGFIIGKPYAEFDAINGPGRQRSYDPHQGLDEIRGWLAPWIEEVTGAPAEQMVEGWSAPYGDGIREWTVMILAGHPASKA